VATNYKQIDGKYRNLGDDVQPPKDPEVVARTEKKEPHNYKKPEAKKR